MQNRKDIRKKRRNDIAAVGLTMLVCTTVVGTSSIDISTQTKEKNSIKIENDFSLTAGIANVLKNDDIERMKKECSLKCNELEKTMLAMETETSTEMTTEMVTEVPTEEPKNYTEEDWYWLSHAIAAEVGNSTYESKAMCGLVIINRVNSSSFKSDTIEEVIFSPGQYETVSNGKIYDEPDDESIEIAKKILEETIEIEIPSDVVYQAEFPQGSGIYCQIGYEYYCYND